MIRPRVHRRLAAYLALAAMWLIVLAPVVSQTLFAAQAAGSESGWCGPHPPPASIRQDPHAPHTELCGYCDLLAHSPVLLGVARLVAAPPAEPLPPPVRRQLPHAPPQPLRIAAPRGPPSFVDASA